jgi:uncharacterized membrane protein
LESDTKESVVRNVIATGKLEKLYWFELVLSAVIATLGLLQNSIPVVIGVMLIAPLLRPIQFFSFTIAASHHKKILYSLKNIL